MNTLFSAVPFERFNLGKYAMAQAVPVAVPVPTPVHEGPGPGPGCPLGQIAMRQPNGAVTCVKYSPPSGMFMPAIPSSGNVAYGMAGMGQGTDPYLSQVERDQTLLQIQNTMWRVPGLEALIAWSEKNDPGLKRHLGMDASRFFALAGKVSPLYSGVKDLADRLAQTDAEYWYRPSDQEMADLKQWLVGVNEMAKILQAHPTSASPLPPGTPPPPSVAASAPAGGGALTSTGLTTEEVLVGAVVLAAGGALLYKLLGK